MDDMKTNTSGYTSLIVQTIISGVIMYLVMFVMIDDLDSFYNNLNMFYMTLMMVAPMVVLMILAMQHMFPSKGANAAILAGAIRVLQRKRSYQFRLRWGQFALVACQSSPRCSDRNLSTFDCHSQRSYGQKRIKRLCIRE